MKIQLKINEKPFKETILFNILYTVLVMVRILFVIALLYIPMIVSLIILNILGVKNVFSKYIELFEGLSFLGDKP